MKLLQLPVLLDRCLSFCHVSFWPLCCLFLFNLRILITFLVSSNSSYWDRRGRDPMVVGFTTTCAINVEHRSWRGAFDTTLCDKFCQCVSPGTLVSSTNKTDLHDIAEILLKVALNTIHQA